MFRKLRGKFWELDIDQKYLAQKFDCSVMTISHCMTGKKQWTLDWMYAILDLIDEPYDQLPTYFPKGGVTP
ncbi:MAG: hypothetical protein RSE64_06945 [Oscillospiraceae bacterium]